jgi:DNA-binding transcriptional MerR regulator
MVNEPRYSLAELARVTGVTPRTVRYYIVQGLLPGANDGGPAAWYDERHLGRLRLIRELQREHLPLAEIRARLEQLGDQDVAQLLQERAVQASAPSSSALDYVRGLLATTSRPSRQGLLRRSVPRPAPVPPSPMGEVFRSSRTPAPGMAARAVTPMNASTPEAPQSPPDDTSVPARERSQWDRVSLTNDIELHVRRPLSRLDNRRVERLITIARQVLGEEKP